MDHERDKELLLLAVGARVRALRLEAGLTVKDFAERAALSPRFVQQLEGGAANISIAGLARVAAAMGRSLTELIPPASDDHSLPAQIWRLLSDRSADDPQELQQWLEQRKGPKSKRSWMNSEHCWRAGSRSTLSPI